MLWGLSAIIVILVAGLLILDRKYVVLRRQHDEMIDDLLATIERDGDAGVWPILERYRRQ